MKESCNKFLDQLVDAPQLSEAAKKHIAMCPDCNQAFQNIRALQANGRILTGEIPSIRQNVMRRISALTPESLPGDISKAVIAKIFLILVIIATLVTAIGLQLYPSSKNIPQTNRNAISVEKSSENWDTVDVASSTCSASSASFIQYAPGEDFE